MEMMQGGLGTDVGGGEVVPPQHDGVHVVARGILLVEVLMRAGGSETSFLTKRMNGGFVSTMKSLFLRVAVLAAPVSCATEGVSQGVFFLTAYNSFWHNVAGVVKF